MFVIRHSEFFSSSAGASWRHFCLPRRFEEDSSSFFHAELNKIPASDPGKRSWQAIPASDPGKRFWQAILASSGFFKFLNLLPKVYYMLQVYLVNTPPCGITKPLHSSIISIMTRTRNKVLLQRESRKQLDHQQQFPVDELGWQINRARLLNEREKDGGFKRWIKVVSNSGFFPHSDKCNAALHLWICY